MPGDNDKEKQYVKRLAQSRLKQKQKSPYGPNQVTSGAQGSHHRTMRTNGPPQSLPPGQRDTIKSYSPRTKTTRKRYSPVGGFGE